MFVLLHLYIVSLFFFSLANSFGKINIKKIAELVNSIENHPWKASSYNFDEIDAHDFSASRLGLKEYADSAKLLNIEDYQEVILEDAQKSLENDEPSVTSDRDLPENFTWADSELMKKYGCRMDIKQQSNCDSSWAIGPVSSFENRLCIHSKGKMNLPLSSNYVVACSSKNRGCYGGSTWGVHTFLQDCGTVSGGEYGSEEGCQPYSIRPCGFPHDFPCSHAMAFNPKCKNGTCTNPTYSKKRETKFHRITGWNYLSNVQQEMREIYDNGPITASFVLYPDFITYKSGIYSHTRTIKDHALGEHLVRVVGWGVENGTKYWHATNSWGEYWGENGYFRIIRGVNKCFFESWMQYVNVTIS